MDEDKKVLVQSWLVKAQHDLAHRHNVLPQVKTHYWTLLSITDSRRRKKR